MNLFLKSKKLSNESFYQKSKSSVNYRINNGNNKKIKRKKSKKNSQIKKLSATYVKIVLKFIRADKVYGSINKNVKIKI